MTWDAAEMRRCIRKAMRRHGIVGWLNAWNRFRPWRRAAEGFTWAEYRRQRRSGRARVKAALDPATERKGK